MSGGDNTERLRLPNAVRRIERGDKVIYLNPVMPAWVVTNAVGDAVMTLFDGTNSTAEIVQTVTEALGEDCSGQVTEFIALTRQSAIFRTEPAERHARDTRLHSVHLSLSERCNLRCRYCYAKQRDEGGRQPLSAKQWCRVIDDLCDLNPDITFTLTGGEPLLNPDWLTISRHIREAYPDARLLLLTNGTLITERNISDIKDVAHLVTLSLDGDTPETHALTRGDNYSRVMRAVDLLESHDVDYTVSMTVTRLNIDRVEAMARRFGSRLNYQPLFPVNGHIGDTLSITGEQYYHALNSAFGVNPLGYCEAQLDRSREMRCVKCALGDNEISISPTGDVYPCQLLHEAPFLADNVTDRPVADIVRDAPALRRCAALTVDAVDGCRDCDVRYICGGACRARAYYETGDIARRGDFCRQYEREALLDGLVKLYSANAVKPL